MTIAIVQISSHKVPPNAGDSGAKNAQRFWRPAPAKQVRTDRPGYVPDSDRTSITTFAAESFTPELQVNIDVSS